MIGRIYTRLLEHCPRVTLNPRWQFLNPDEDSRLVAGDLSPALALLRRQFDTEDLQKAGVLVRNNNRVRLNAKLATDDRVLIVLRDSQGKPFDILTSAGSLQRIVPILAVQHDVRTEKGLAATDRRLFVTSSIEESVVVRALGLPAVPATHMDCLQGTNFRAMLTMTDGFSDRSDIFHAVLVGCNLAEGICEIPANVAAVARHFGQAKRYLALPGLAVSVWWPSDEEMKNLEYRRGVGSARMVREFLKRVSALHDIAEFADPSKSPSREPTYASALENLLEAEAKRRQNDYSELFAKKVRTAREEYMQQVDRAIFEPLLESATSSRDLSLRALRLQLAHIGRVLHRAMPSVHDAQVRSAEAEGGDPIDFLPDADWKRFQALMDMTTKLIREETRLRKSTLVS